MEMDKEVGYKLGFTSLCSLKICKLEFVLKRQSLKQLLRVTGAVQTLMFSRLFHQVKTVRPCLRPATQGPVKMVEYVRSLKTTGASPASALKDGKVSIYFCFKCSFTPLHKSIYSLDNEANFFFKPLFLPQGQTCEIDINECVKSPCRNGAICHNTIGGYQCMCQPGYTGPKCETDTDDCKPSKQQKFTFASPHPACKISLETDYFILLFFRSLQ